MPFTDRLKNIRDAITGRTPEADAPSWRTLLPTTPRTFFGGADDLIFSNTATLDLRDAWNLAELSLLAYWDDADIKAVASQLAPSRWTLTPFGKGNGSGSAAGPVQAILASSDKTAVLAFRGTRLNGFPALTELFQLTAKPVINLYDLGVDLGFVLNTAGVHFGFHDAFNQWHSAFREKIDEALKGKKHIYITGHSLGGALAGLAAHAWKGLGNVSLYTFGCPRFCNVPFGAGYTGLPIHRFVYRNDFVTSVPPAIDMLPTDIRYTHVGDMQRLDSHSVVSPAGREPDLLSVLSETISGTPLSWAVNATTFYEVLKSGQPWNPRISNGTLTDHAPKNYADALRRAAGIV